MTKTHNSRRAFFLQGGATLGAGLAATAGAAALVPPGTANSNDAQHLADSHAIRQLHHRFVAEVESQNVAAAEPTHRAYRANAAQQHDVLQVDVDGIHARATWHVDVQLAILLEGDSTAAQMARLQGQLQYLSWETGLLEARYEKVAGNWRLAGLAYRSA